MSDLSQCGMAPDGQSDSCGPVQRIADMAISADTSTQDDQRPPDRAVITSPLPSGILFKGRRLHKSVSFRDSDLVNIREIPPRSSSPDFDSDEGVAGSSDSDDDTDSESDQEEEEVDAPQPPQPAPASPVVDNGADKPVTVNGSKTPPTTVVKTPPTAVSASSVRPERAPIPWTHTSSFSAAKGSFNNAVSAATKGVSVGSSGNAVTPSHIHSVPRPRSASVVVSSSSSPVRKPPSSMLPRKLSTELRAEKRVKRITPTLDNVISLQTMRSVQKHSSVSDSVQKTRTGKKKRVVQRRAEGSDKRKTTPSKKNKDSKQNTKDSKNTNKVNDASASRQTSGGRKSVSPAPGKVKSVVNGFHNARDSLSLPPLGSDDSVLLNTPKLLQQRPAARTTVYTVDGFIFPGDPVQDLATGAKPSTRTEDARLRPHGPSATPVNAYSLRDRINSAPAATSSTRRKRFYAWQMANGNLQDSLNEQPSITPMWETVTPVTTPLTKPAYVADR